MIDARFGLVLAVDGFVTAALTTTAIFSAAFDHQIHGQSGSRNADASRAKSQRKEVVLLYYCSF
jgi:hypothetical protein